ncbi:MAG: putative extracellular repeat, family [Actinomycetia bacterium]|nr:putative extracellular repeat, family [Actinomycetes bacterium]
MSIRRATIVASTLSSFVLVAVSATAGGTAFGIGTDAHTCLPSIVALPLPAGFTNGDVLSAAADEAVGYVADDSQHQHVAVWQRSRGAWSVTDLGDFGITEPFSGLSATGVNGSGLVSIGVNTNVMGAWVFTHGAVHRLADFAGGQQAFARAVSSDGKIVGEALDASGNDFAALWPQWWSAPVALSPVAGYDGSFAQGIDSQGDVVGGSFSNGPSPTVATRWTPAGRPVALPGLGGPAQAFDVATPHRVVGVANTETGPRAVVWDSHDGVRDLGVFAGLQFSRAIGVAEGGVVVGFEGSNPPPPAIPLRRVLLWPGTGPVRSLLPLSLNWSDGAYSHSADDHGNVFGASSAGAMPRPTEWTCALAQSFVPGATGVGSEPSTWPSVVGLDSGGSSRP